jgi:ribonuclease HI
MNLLAEDSSKGISEGEPEREKKKKKKEAKSQSKENSSKTKKKKRLKVRQTSTRVGEYHLMQFDGGARGNPGIAGAGVVLMSPDGQVLHKKSLFLGDDRTNNQAEYEALLLGLQMGLDLGYKKLEVEGDSLLVIQQVAGDWQVRSEKLALLLKKVVAVLDQMEDVVIRHIPRDQNKIADELANTAMDEKSRGDIR